MLYFVERLRVVFVVGCSLCPRVRSVFVSVSLSTRNVDMEGAASDDSYPRGGFTNPPGCFQVIDLYLEETR